MAKNGKKLAKKIIFAIVAACIIGAILIVALGLEIAFVISDKIECWRPDYEKEDLTEVLNKTALDDTDYEFLYAQTGLTKAGVDRALSRGAAGKARIKQIQQDFFAEHTVTNAKFAPYVCTDYIEKNVANIYYEKGDILISSSTHISGVRIGHAALVIDGTNVLQANAYGSVSRVSSAAEFTNRVNFMVFHVKDETADRKTLNEIVDYAEKNLQDIPYEGLAGLLSNKEEISKTQCAHIVWYAFKQFGIDLDSNGGSMVTPYDMANSPHLELVQVFGLDTQKLWR
ncbi:MAG: hypothetical protein K2K80_02165 [Clostridia bacterium]|nr:hypothetical protein [Clostridia bacterium]